ncbi:MAG TPA: M20/M25/M40 family metallo-hydrolase [Gemmatimonadaceae bacterium]|jgi:glutamate carboxypeptidase|nr:M20/M25/M40 family metallo-hydrolase [Gemmatimonadaceae bacterium]
MKVYTSAALIPLFAIAPSISHAQGLSPAERKMQAYVEQHTADEIAYLAKLVNINSGTMNSAGVRAVGDEFAKELNTLGFQSRWASLPDSLHRAGHLISEHRAKNGKAKGRRILLIGHLDTVFEGEGQKWKQLDDSTAKGAGSSDMKGGDVAVLYALKAMAAAGTLDDTDIIVAFMGDEESAGEPFSISRKDLVDAAKRSDAILAFEEDNGKATVARRGWSSWLLKVTAKAAHTQGIFSEGSGYGAIYEVARILNAFRETMAGEKYLTFSAGVIVGGTNVAYDTTLTSGTASGKLNIIPKEAQVQGDLRFLTLGQLDSARARMREIVAKNLPGTSAQITFPEASPPMPPTPGNYALLATLDTVTRALGYGPTEALDPGLRGAGDISFVGQYADALDGLGVIGHDAHTPDETVDLRSIPKATIRAAVLINRLAHSRKR